MNWPWSKPAPETRGYSDALLDRLYESAGQSTFPASGGSAANVGATWISRTLSTVTLTPGPGSIPFRSVDMNAVGRDLVRSGQSIWVLRGRHWVQCSPIVEVRVSPGNRASWLYNLKLAGSDRTSRALGLDVLHFQWSHDAGRPEVGIGPLEIKAAKLAAVMEGLLLNEGSSAFGYLMGLPPGSDPFLDTLKEKLGSLKGRLLSIENSFKPSPMRPEQDAQFSIFREPVRFGFNPPETVLETWQQASAMVFESLGLPAQLLTKAEGMASPRTSEAGPCYAVGAHNGGRHGRTEQDRQSA